MAQIKVLKFISGIPKEMNTSLDDIVAKSFVVGGPSGTSLTKAILDTLSSGSSDASSLHNHDTQYWRKTQHIDASAGASDAGLPMMTDARGKIDPSFYQQSDITHGNLSGLASDDHTQYHNDTRGDARYYRQDQFINSSAGVADANKPVKTNAQGQIDGTMLAASASSIDHEDLSGLLGGAASDHYHLTQSQHNTLTDGSDATTLHNHDSRYYTKAQTDASLALKADDSTVIKKNGSAAFTADQSMGGYKLTNLADGISSSDAVNKGQMDAADALAVQKSGDTMSGNLDLGGNKITNLGAPLAGTDAVNKNYVDNKVTGLSWRPEVALFDATNSSKPSLTSTQIDGVTVADGMRVLFTALSASNNEVYKATVSGGNITWTLETDGQAGNGTPSEGDTVLVTEGTDYSGSTWSYNGSAWVQTNGAGQIQAGTGLSKSGNTLNVNLGAGIKELPTDEVGLDLHVNGALDLVDPSTGLPSSNDDAQLSVMVDNVTIQSGAALSVKDAGIDENKLAASVAGAGLTGGAGSALAVNTGDGLEIVSDAVKVKASDIAGAGLEDDGSNNLRLAATVAGNALSINTTTGVMDVNVDNSTIEVNTDALRVKDAGITNAKIAAQAVNAPKIDFGTGANQVHAGLIPLADAANQFATDDVASALSELATQAYIESFTAGETIGQGDLVCLRRDASNNLKAYKASAAGNDNYVSATLVLGDITYTAVTPSGNDITVTYLNPGVINAALSVSVLNNDITVHLATDGSASITSTASQINTAVQGNSSAAALVSSAVTGSGSQIQTAYAQTYLSGGMDFNDNGRWVVEGLALGAANAGQSVRVQKAGALTCSFVTSPAAKDIGKDVYLSVNQGKAAVAVAPSSTNDGIVFIGRLRSATQIEFKCAILRGVNG